MIFFKEVYLVSEGFYNVFCLWCYGLVVCYLRETMSLFVFGWVSVWTWT